MEHYRDVIIPKIESELQDNTKSKQELLELYGLYVDIMRVVAPMDFITFNKYLELDENHNDPNKAFYHHRKNHLVDIFKSLNDMEIYDSYDMLLITTPSRVGKSTSGIRFLAWIAGRYPEYTQMAVSYSDAITSSFYTGVMEIVDSERFKEVFPHAPLVNQNAKKQEISLAVIKRYPSLMFIPIGGSMTGRGDAKQYIYCDDLVSGYEEAVSRTRLEKLWNLYTVNVKQRKSDKCKEIHVATRWSVHDPITRLSRENKDNSRCKIIVMPWHDDNYESQFDFVGGFSTKYYLDLKNTMEPASFSAIFEGNPIEREGLLYHSEDLQYYFDLPNEKPDSIIGICDSKNMGKDYVASIVGYCYGDNVYIEDVVYNNGLPEITRPLVARMLVEHNVIRADVEMNNGGNYYAEDLDQLVKEYGGKTSIRMFFSGNNKNVKIVTYSDFIKKNFIFKHESTYAKNSMYADFMKDLFGWTQVGNNAHDDAPDALAMLAQLFQDLDGMSVKILNRKQLGI